MPRKKPTPAVAPDAVAAPAVHTTTKAKFVTVALKTPMHIQLQLCTPFKQSVVGQFGSAEETIYRKTGEVYTIRGTSYPSGAVPKGFYKAPNLIEDNHGGYALTKNIPAAFWYAWLEQNKDTDMVRNGVIKAEPDLDSLESSAAEHADVSSGLGPLNPDQDEKGRPLDRRAPRPMNVGVSDIKEEPRTQAA